MFFLLSATIACICYIMANTNFVVVELKGTVLSLVVCVGLGSNIGRKKTGDITLTDTYIFHFNKHSLPKVLKITD